MHPPCDSRFKLESNFLLQFSNVSRVEQKHFPCTRFNFTLITFRTQNQLILNFIFTPDQCVSLMSPDDLMISDLIVCIKQKEGEAHD